MSKTLKIMFFSVIIGTIVAGTSLGVTTVELNQNPFWLTEISEPLVMLIAGIGMIGLAWLGRMSLRNDE
jgi:hypothetical protein